MPGHPDASAHAIQVALEDELGDVLEKAMSCAGLSPEALAAITVIGRVELPPVARVTYYGFCDASGGGSDSYTIAAAHREDDACVLDAMREVRPPQYRPSDPPVRRAGALLQHHAAGQ